jgi:type II secretory pathway pseudopilin PulG
MKISRSVHPADSSAGFTLLEMCLVLFVMALLVGVSVFSFGGVSQEEALRRPVSEFQRMVMEAVRRASLYERPQVIAFDAKGFAMKYRSDANGQVSSDDSQIWQRRVEMPAKMRLTIRRFGSDKFAPAAGQRLIIAPSGLCEPIAARFELDGSYLMIELDPLSGVVRNEEMSVRGDGS